MFFFVEQSVKIIYQTEKQQKKKKKKESLNYEIVVTANKYVTIKLLIVFKGAASANFITKPPTLLFQMSKLFDVTIEITRRQRDK